MIGIKRKEDWKRNRRNKVLTRKKDILYFHMHTIQYTHAHTSWSNTENLGEKYWRINILWTQWSNSSMTRVMRFRRLFFISMTWLIRYVLEILFCSPDTITNSETTRLGMGWVFSLLLWGFRKKRVWDWLTNFWEFRIRRFGISCWIWWVR